MTIHTPKTVHVQPGSELDRLRASADEAIDLELCATASPVSISPNERR
jgi:hypothetical protein